jgi:hypothetical protein
MFCKEARITQQEGRRIVMSTWMQTDSTINMSTFLPLSRRTVRDPPSSVFPCHSLSVRGMGQRNFLEIFYGDENDSAVSISGNAALKHLGPAVITRFFFSNLHILVTYSCHVNVSILPEVKRTERKATANFHLVPRLRTREALHPCL